MMANWLLGFVQITGIVIAAILLGNYCLRRAPETTARVAFSGMILATLLLLTIGLNIPRPWQVNVTLDTVNAPVASNVLKSEQQILGVNNRVDDTESGSAQLSNVEWSIAAKQLLSSVVDFSTSWIRPESKTRQWLIPCTLAIFITFALWYSLRIAVGMCTALRMERQSILVPRYQLPFGVQAFLDKHDPNHEILVRAHIGIHSPCVHMLDRRAIFVPPAMLDWSPAEALSAIAHEFAHLVRRDARYRFVVEGSMVLLGLHPLAQLLKRQVILAQELSTDRWAANAIGNYSQYQRGLTLLALRLDRTHRAGLNRYPFSVGLLGFSNGLVRRIKMLQASKQQETRLSKHLTWVMVASLMAFAVAAGGWQLNADEPVRIATKPDVPSTPSVQNNFQRPSDSPWESLGGAAGYASVLVSEANDHPAISLLLDQVTHNTTFNIVKPDATGNARSLADLGLEIAKISKIQSTVIVNITENASAADSDEKHQATLGANAFNIITPSPVDWPQLVMQLNGLQYGFSDETLTKIASDIAKTDNLLLGKNDDSSDVPENLKKLWAKTSGGIATIAFSVPKEPFANADPSDLESTEKRTVDLIAKLNGIGLGVDCEPGYPALALRLTLLAGPTLSSAELQQATEGIREAVLNDLRAEEDAASSMLVRAIENSTLRIETDSAGQTIVATYETEIDPLAYFIALQTSHNGG